MRVMVSLFCCESYKLQNFIDQTGKTTFFYDDKFHSFLIIFQASSLNIAEKAGEIIRDVMQRGELGVVDKVFKRNSPPTYIKKLLKPLQGENKQFDPQTEADR